MKLNVQRYGAGQPLIVLHGLFGSLTNWHTLNKRFGAHYEVFAVDQRNHGSSPHSDQMSYALLADDLRELIDRFDLPRVHLLGHSMGGKTAMQTALRYPDRVASLIVVDIAPRAYPPHHDDIFAALRGLDLPSYRSRAELDAAIAPQIPDRTTRQFLLTNVTRGDDGIFRWRINLEGLFRDYDAVVAAITGPGTFDGPTLFVRGERSEYIGDDDEAAIRALFPRASIETVPGAGHWVHAEAPDAFADLALRFLDRVDRE